MLKITKQSPQRFRAQCTGIGQTRQASEMTGARRAQCAIDCAPKAQVKFAAAAGYPQPTEAYCIDGGVTAHQMRTLR